MTLQRYGPYRYGEADQMGIEAFVAAVQRGKDDSWPLSLLAPHEMEHLRQVVKWYHEGEVCLREAPQLLLMREQLRRQVNDPRLRDELRKMYQEILEPLEQLPGPDQLKQQLERVRQEILCWCGIVLERGRQASLLFKKLEEKLGELSKLAGDAGRGLEAIRCPGGAD